MRWSIRAVALCLMVALLALGAHFHLRPRAVIWEGDTDINMLHQVRADLDAVWSGGTLIVTLLSPGGPVITSLEIARLVRDASDRGITVEIHAVALCASGCTFVLAAGTPGHRYIGERALYLVHPIQQGTMFGSSCVDRQAVSASEAVRDATPLTEQDKILTALYDSMVAFYIEFSGRSVDEVEQWLKCGNEQAGGGAVAVRLGLADHVE